MVSSRLLGPFILLISNSLKIFFSKMNQRDLDKFAISTDSVDSLGVPLTAADRISLSAKPPKNLFTECSMPLPDKIMRSSRRVNRQHSDSPQLDRVRPTPDSLRAHYEQKGLSMSSVDRSDRELIKRVRRHFRDLSQAEKLKQPILALGLSDKLCGSLEKAGYFTLQDLLTTRMEHLLSIKSVGVKSMITIVGRLKLAGLVQTGYKLNVAHLKEVSKEVSKSMKHAKSARSN